MRISWVASCKSNNWMEVCRILTGMRRSQSMRCCHCALPLRADFLSARSSVRISRISTLNRADVGVVWDTLGLVSKRLCCKWSSHHCLSEQDNYDRRHATRALQQVRNRSDCWNPWARGVHNCNESTNPSSPRALGGIVEELMQKLNRQKFAQTQTSGPWQDILMLCE